MTRKPMRSEFDRQSAQQSETLVTAKSAGKAAWPADHVERWPIERLMPYARNARTHSDAQVSQIAASIREWGWTNPVLVAEDGTIIAGHGRVLAARKLRIAHVPVMWRPAGPSRKSALTPLSIGVGLGPLVLPHPRMLP